ncbi:MAG: hypothetical protein GXY08_08805 [Ruminococcus sp.]|nr:hypothetical protein [Ruminococcus sp.]
MLKTRKYICTALAALTLITGSAATSFATGNDIFPSVMISLDANAQDIAVNQERYATKAGAHIVDGAGKYVATAAVGYTFTVDTIRAQNNKPTLLHSDEFVATNGKKVKGWIKEADCSDSNRGKSKKVKKKTTVKVTKKNDGTKIRREACSGSDALGHVKLNTNYTSDYQVKWDNGEVWYHFEKIKNKENKWVHDCYVFAPLCTVV